MIEYIGIFASVLILVSISVKSSNIKGNILMRVLNTIGSIIFIYYGFVLQAYSTAILNIGAAIVNIIYIFKLIKTDEVVE